jgi:hypothetical protein
MQRRVTVSHPNLLTYLGHLQRATVDYMNDVARVTNGLHIRRPKKKTYLTNESLIKLCIDRFDTGNYTRWQFLTAANNSVGAHSELLYTNSSDISHSEDDAVNQNASTKRQNHHHHHQQH